MHQKAHLIGKKRSANKELCIASGCCANPVEAGLCGYSEEYRYSSAKFYETGVNDPIAIGFGFITHWMD